MNNLLQLCFWGGRSPKHVWWGMLSEYTCRGGLHWTLTQRAEYNQSLLSSLQPPGEVNSLLSSFFPGTVGSQTAKTLVLHFRWWLCGLSKDYIFTLCYEWYSYHIARFAYQLPLPFILKTYPCLQALRTCERD